MRGRKPGSSRRRAREAALQILYAVDLISTHPTPPADSAIESPAAECHPRRRRAPPPPPTPTPGPEDVFEAVAAGFEIPEGARDFAGELVRQVRGHAEALDSTIAAHARNWRITRMAVVDRNILRLATWELIYTETPSAVILDEAVDLARRFGDDPSPAFVNGILDAVARSVRELQS